MKLEGFAPLQRALVRAPDLVRVHASSAVASSTFAVAQRAKALVPVSTGNLKRAIGTTRTVNGLTGNVGITDASAYYWRYVEFGTRHAPARPFFRPAAESERDGFIQRMRQIGGRLERDLSSGRLL
jgi:HK97 gp10 family phage protein